MLKKVLLILSISLITLTGVSSTSYGGTIFDSQVLSLNLNILGAEFPEGDWRLERVSSASIDYVCINNDGCEFDVLNGNLPNFGRSGRECEEGAIVSIAHDFIILPFDCNPESQ